MSEIGVIKEIDNLGRIVIPKEMRMRYSFEREVELILTEDGVLIRSPKYKLIEREELSDR